MSAVAASTAAFSDTFFTNALTPSTLALHTTWRVARLQCGAAGARSGVASMGSGGVDTGAPRLAAPGPPSGAHLAWRGACWQTAPLLSCIVAAFIVAATPTAPMNEEG
jgi:hypothetical protein